MISSIRKKVIDCEILEKRSIGTPGNYIGISTNMKVEGVKRLINRWIEEGFNFASYCHDNNAAVRSVFTQHLPDTTEKLDKNHLMKQFWRLFSKFNEKNSLRGLKPKIEKWLFFLLRSNFSCKEKESKWLGALQHFTSKSQLVPYKWPLASNPKSVEALSKLLEASLFIIHKCGYDSSTQHNECLHSLKAHYANKLFNFDSSFRCRIFSAILRMN